MIYTTTIYRNRYVSFFQLHLHVGNAENLEIHNPMKFFWAM